MNAGKGLPATHFQVFRGETEQTVFHVSIGKSYPVFAMALWQSVIIILLLDDTGKPNWYSIEIFSIVDPKLSDDWYFSTTIANDHGVQAIWGYEHMTSNPKHYEAVIERDPEALRVFDEQRRRDSATEESSTLRLEPEGLFVGEQSLEAVIHVLLDVAMEER